MSKSQKGFSLIEICFVAAGLILVLSAAYFFSDKFQRSAAVQSEATEFADHYRLADTALRSDFQTAGHNFALASDAVFGGEYSLYFQPDEHWNQLDALRTDGSTYRQTAASGEYLKSNLIVRKGSGTINFRLAAGNYRIGFRGVDNESNSRYVQVNDTRLVILENGENVFAAAVDTGSGSRRNVRLALEYLQGQSACIADYYLETDGVSSLLYRSLIGCPAYPLEAAAVSTETGSNFAELQNLKISGTDMISRESVSEQSFVYPSFNGREISSPIIRVEESGSVPNSDFGNLLFFGGSPDTDVYYTRENVIIRDGAAASIAVSQPSASAMTSPITDNDVVNLIDYGNRQSVLGVVSGVTSASLTFTPLTADYSFGGFYSLPVNYREHQFSTGASLVKVFPPVEWRFVNHQLLRRAAGTPWQTVALGVSAAKITESTLNRDYSDGRGGSLIRSFAVTLLIRQDGSETAQDGAAPEQPFRAVYTPPAINRDSNN